MIGPMDISRRRAVQGVIGLVCSIALAVTGVAAQAAPPSAAAPQVTPSPSRQPRRLSRPLPTRPRHRTATTRTMSPRT